MNSVERRKDGREPDGPLHSIILAKASTAEVRESITKAFLVPKSAIFVSMTGPKSCHRKIEMGFHDRNKIEVCLEMSGEKPNDFALSDEAAEDRARGELGLSEKGHAVDAGQ